MCKLECGAWSGLLTQGGRSILRIFCTAHANVVLICFCVPILGVLSEDCIKHGSHEVYVADDIVTGDILCFVVEAF